jgi:hypothetical protein
MTTLVGAARVHRAQVVGDCAQANTVDAGDSNSAEQLRTPTAAQAMLPLFDARADRPTTNPEEAIVWAKKLE